ncbi:MAG: HlyD family efflux transporter periplasmic adaptor subunit [Rhodospirillales bacterium]
MPDAGSTTSVQPPPRRERLFRTEVFAENQTRWLGTVLLAPGISQFALTAFALAAAVAVISLLVFGQYTRKARINGWLVPQQGVLRVFAPLPGVVIALPAREGMEVAKGAPLLALSTELQSEALGATREEIVRRLQSRRDSLKAERETRSRLYARRVEDVSARLLARRSEQRYLQEQAEFQRSRLKLAEEAENRQKLLLQGGNASLRQAQQAQEERLNQAMTLGELERSQAATRREILEMEGELGNLPLSIEMERADVDRQIAALEQEIAETEAQREIVIQAPQAGTVTAVQAELGSNVGTSAPLMNIVPAGQKLEAQLFGTSRAIGFIRAGQRVLLRYDAFPYQKFGQYEGVVAEVSRTAINPAELTQLSGLTSLFAADEPVYRITVALARQTATAYGEAVPLQPGMQLEADVLMEKRRLIEWMFEPLISITGKWWV